MASGEFASHNGLCSNLSIHQDICPCTFSDVTSFPFLRWIHDYQDACVDKLEKFISGEISTRGSSLSVTRPSLSKGNSLSSCPPTPEMHGPSFKGECGEACPGLCPTNGGYSSADDTKRTDKPWNLWSPWETFCLRGLVLYAVWVCYYKMFCFINSDRLRQVLYMMHLMYSFNDWFWIQVEFEELILRNFFFPLHLLKVCSDPYVLHISIHLTIRWLHVDN